MGLQNKFASDDPYILGALSATAKTNQSDLQVVIRETDHLKATSVYFQGQGLTNTVANPSSNATLVAAQTIGQAVGDGEIELPTCPEISQWILVEREGEKVPVRAESITLDDFVYNMVTRKFEKVIRADIVEDSELWEVVTANGCKAIASHTAPLISGTWDIKGVPLNRVAKNMNVISMIEWNTEYTRTTQIFKKRKRGAILHLSTAGPSHIYCCGANPDKFLALHNRKPDA